MSNWYQMLKQAIYGHDDVGRIDDQLVPTWNPYGKRRKSPEDTEDTKTKQFDGGTGMGDTRDFIEQYDEMAHENILDQYDSGEAQKSPVNQDAPLDTVSDPPMNNGNGPLELQQTPLGEHAQTQRRVEDSNPNKRIRDNQSGRLPGGSLLPPPKLPPRIRRSQSVSPLDEAWAHLTKKG